MITYIAQMRVPPENHEAYEALMSGVRAKVREHEAEGVPYYEFSKSVDDPDLYLVIEVYRDEAAHTAHMQSDWVTQSLPRALELMTGKPEIRQYVSPGAEPIRARYVR